MTPEQAARVDNLLAGRRAEPPSDAEIANLAAAWYLADREFSAQPPNTQDRTPYAAPVVNAKRALFAALAQRPDLIG